METLAGLKREKLTIDLVKANLFSIGLVLPVFLIFGGIYYLIWGEPVAKLFSEETTATAKFGIYLIVFFIGIVIHEMIHGVTWALFAKNGLKSIKYGVLWKVLTPYCHCQDPLEVKNYIMGAIMPFLILGLLPSIVGIASGNVACLFFGIIFTISAAGDFMIIHLIRNEPPGSLVLDHPTEAGCYVFRP